jgi:hypothetical protein
MGAFNPALIRPALDAARCHQMLAGYLLIERDSGTIRRLILQDIERFKEMGATAYATRLTTVLMLFESKFFQRPTTKPLSPLRGGDGRQAVEGAAQ